ncbi:alpha/beta hydrolase family protein [Novipirellula artificiosorum]|uniref:Alpha/beta hydrolase family protein n=1 Tax=Novipirellula artificiosorum TaxID=2528016 RepID=A0A5C6DC50_9BACT|nr:alpha/beta fold hydrolase [Novipirellula artificiosorum]TWU34382.1 Alpha/beta hydrolase family protein [Novipirellula artificiosorum]
MRDNRLQVVRKSYRVKFQGAMGDSLAGIIDRPDTTDPVPVVVLSHCFTCSKDLKAIVRVSRGLSERGIAVLRFDMTGIGGSRGDFSQTNFATNLEDLRAAIRFAAGELGPVTTLYGHSFGGAASLALAGSNHPDDAAEPVLSSLRSVISLGSPSDTWHLAVRLTKMNPRIDIDGMGEVTIGGVAWTIRKQMVDNYRQYDLASRISRIKLPTLLLHSPIDETVGFDHALRIMMLINQSQGEASTPCCSLLSLPGADHLLKNDPRDLDFVVRTSAAMVHRYSQMPERLR